MTTLTTLSMGSLPEGFPKIPPGGMPGTNPRTCLLVQVEQRQRQKTTTWCTRSGDGHCLMQLSCLCWMWAAEWPGSSWMTKLFWTVMLCCRKASCAMSSRKSAQRHGKELQDKGLRSPLCCLADKWQMNGLTSCFLKGTCGPPSLPRGLPRHLWMDIKIGWDLLLNRMYTEAPTGMSREQLYDLLFNRASKGNQRNPYEEKAYRGPDHREVQARWEQNQRWMWYYKHQRAPLVLDINGFIRAFRGKDENARAEIDTYMDYCAKRWQTREGAYQLTRRRLLPDVRDPPEQGEEEVDMMDIWSFTWMASRTHYKVEEMKWEFGGRAGFTLFARIFTGSSFCVFVWLLLFVCLAVVLFCLLCRWNDSCM